MLGGCRGGKWALPKSKIAGGVSIWVGKGGSGRKREWGKYRLTAEMADLVVGFFSYGKAECDIGGLEVTVVFIFGVGVVS